MPRVNYKLRPAIEALRTARMLIGLSPGQIFIEAPKSFAILQDYNSDISYIIKRIPKSRVFFVYVKDGWGWCPNCEKDVKVDGRLDAAGIYDVCQECGERTI